MSKKTIASFFQPLTAAKKQKTEPAVNNKDENKGPESANAAAGIREEKTEAAPTPTPTITLTAAPADSVVPAGTREASLLQELANSTRGDWNVCLRKELQKPYAKALNRFLEAEKAANKVVYPEPACVFAALNLCPLENIKVVIIGQDPYHGPNQAHGLAFSVLPGVAVPPSLSNIYKELTEDEKISFSRPRHGHLAAWAKQGVLLLNTCLTVRRSEANSHQKQGWETLTDAIVREVARKQGIVYLLWGKPAQTKCKSIDGKKNCIIQTPHPSPLSAHRGFLGSRCFSQCNEYLVVNGKEPIDWALLSDV